VVLILCCLTGEGAVIQDIDELYERLVLRHFGYCCTDIFPFASSNN